MTKSRPRRSTDNALAELTIADGFNIQHYKPDEGYLNWHSERSIHLTHQRALVFMTYLNDVDDGGTEFLNQKSEVKARKNLIMHTSSTSRA